MSHSKAPWYESWFDSPYYHLLYQHRDDAEAQSFIDHLLERIHLPPHPKVLDLACGKGRHSRYLHAGGCTVTGVDLSEQSIAYCKQFEEPGLEFFEHDMRKVLRVNYYDAVFNLFTSFGYFDSDHQNELVVKAAATDLNKGGYFLLDYLNVVPAVEKMVAQQDIVRDHITFRIRKGIENGYIVKHIEFRDNGTDYHFQERVKVLGQEQLHQYLIKSGLTLMDTFGNYQLEPFHLVSSPRLILLARKL